MSSPSAVPRAAVLGRSRRPLALPAFAAAVQRVRSPLLTLGAFEVGVHGEPLLTNCGSQTHGTRVKRFEADVGRLQQASLAANRMAASLPLGTVSRYRQAQPPRYVGDDAP
eukprot:1681272-Prymnesium_polylepis.1